MNSSTRFALSRWLLAAIFTPTIGFAQTTSTSGAATQPDGPTGETVYSISQTTAPRTAEVAPGLSVPARRSGIPWAIDTAGGQPELVPIHASNINVNNHRGSNFASGMVFGKQKISMEIPGLHARAQLRSNTPVFILPALQSDDEASGTPEFQHWAIVTAQAVKDHRVTQQVYFQPITNKAERHDVGLPVTTTTLPDGRLRLVPTQALAPGEYAILPLTHTANTFSTQVFDFGIDAAAPESAEAIKPHS